MSIIVPVYNVENYLNRCLDSLIFQTLENIEIIVVNDGSQDNSQYIIDQYSKIYPMKIVAFKKKNGGLSDARNFGIKYARGEFISFVDSDDFVDKDMCEKMYKKGQQSSADVVCCPITLIWEKKRKVKKQFFGDTNLFGKSILEKPEILNYVSSYAVTKIYKREFWNKNNFRFPKGQFFEDSALIYNVLLKANIIECVNIPFYYYIKDRVGSICDNVDRTIFDIFKSCDSIINCYINNRGGKNLEPIIINICCKHISMRIESLNNCHDKIIINDFINDTYQFLKKFSKWNALGIYQTSLYPLYRITKNNKMLFKFLLTRFSPKRQNSIAKRLPNYYMSYSLIKKNKLSKKQKLILKRKNVQKYGIEVLCELKLIFDKLGIINFADFGTLLGLIRDDKLLSHDLDLDYGIIHGDFSIQDINLHLERIGFSLWREYFYRRKIVQLSYHYKNIKVDINIYQKYRGQMKTWLFYRSPKTIYKNNERNIVEMEYSSIDKTKPIKVKGCSINIPENNEYLLKEKYGENWKTPDKNWIYWKAPSGKLIDEIGYYFEYNKMVKSW